MTRLAMLPAVLCVVMAGVLGAWGWSERDASRDRARQEDAVDEWNDGGPVFEDPDHQSLVCSALMDAAALQVPSASMELFGYDSPGGAPSVTQDFSDADVAWLLVSILSDTVVSGVGDLDTPPTRVAIDDLRAALEQAVTTTPQPLDQPQVVAAGERLAEVLEGPC